MRIVLLFIFIFLLKLYCFSQSRTDLEKQRINSLEEIKFTNKLIEDTEKSKQASYNKVLLLNKKISSRKQIIQSINDEIKYLNKSIELHQEIIYGLENDLNKLKSEYASLIYHSYLHRSKFDKLMFILAADNFNTAFRRVKYLQQYSKYRINQANKIVETKEEIGNKIVELEVLTSDKKELLVQEKVENQKLVVEKQEKDKEVQVLSKKEKELKKKLENQNRIAENLKKEIAKIILEEAKLAAAKAKVSNTKNLFQLTPEEQLIADNLQKNKNRLPWPTERGIITGEFGEQPHPFLKGIKITNNGVDISTTEGATVRSIFEGTVSKVVSIQGAHKTVIIRHGNYLTVYSNMKDVFVNQGDKIKTKQVIGVVYTETDKEHKTVLQFQIWHEKEMLNPSEWLAKGSNG